MTFQLDRIIQQKQIEVAALREQLRHELTHALNPLLRGTVIRAPRKDFAAALRQPQLSVIAEIKRQAADRGLLVQILDPALQAKHYIESGINAISILTDELSSGGSMADLRLVASTIQSHATPVLRNDFILDEIQIAESILAGADAILVIAALLGDHTAHIMQRAKAMGIDVVVEVYSEADIEIALRNDAKMIAINNRNLMDETIDLERSLRLVEHIPKSILKIAQSGIQKSVVARNYYRAGFDAVFVSEALVEAKDPAYFIEDCQHES